MKTGGPIRMRKKAAMETVQGGRLSPALEVIPDHGCGRSTRADGKETALQQAVSQLQ